MHTKIEYIILNIGNRALSILNLQCTRIDSLCAFRLLIGRQEGNAACKIYLVPTIPKGFQGDQWGTRKREANNGKLINGKLFSYKCIKHFKRIINIKCDVFLLCPRP